MSLDISLMGESQKSTCHCCECGNEHERDLVPTLFESNITHNLNNMAEEAGVYKHLWRPEEIGVTKAGQLIDPLAKAVTLMQSDPPRFKKFNPSNGWGDYDGLLRLLIVYLEACRKYPEATIYVSR